MGQVSKPSSGQYAPPAGLTRPAPATGDRRDASALPLSSPTRGRRRRRPEQTGARRRSDAARSLADASPPEAESIGPESVEPVRPEEELESEAPADVAATHGPSATAVAAAEDEVDLDTVHPQYAPPEQVPAGVPIEVEGGPPPDEGTPAA